MKTLVRQENSQRHSWGTRNEETKTKLREKTREKLEALKNPTPSYGEIAEILTSSAKETCKTNK